MPGEYSAEELREMLNAAEIAENRFPVPAGADLTSTVPSQINLRSSAPTPTAAPNPNAWAAAKTSRTKDFTCPSGQTCRLRKLEPEQLLESGILDRITRLEGLADALVTTAEGQPPKMASTPSREDFRVLLETINQLVVLAVESPALAPVPEEGGDRDALIYVDDVDLEDRMAIMEEALKGLKSLDRFRNPR